MTIFAVPIKGYTIQMPTQPSVATINKLILARHLFRMAEDNLRSQREIALFAAVNLMQDSVEAYLVALAAHVNATTGQSTTFDAYFTKINEHTQPNKLPFQPTLTALNKARVNAKHYGLKPDRKELERFAVTSREFFEETCTLHFGHPFWSISLLDLLADGEIKELLANATRLFDERAYLSCLIECRKVIFVTFEWKYDIAKFRKNLSGLAAVSDAPHYARNKEYIERYVKDPHDYVVIDRQKLDSDLVAQGIDPQVFWNICALSPGVYRSEKGGKWSVKLSVYIKAGADEGHAAYVLEQTIEIALRLDERRRLTRYVDDWGTFRIRLKRDGVSIYDKADRNSEVICVTEPGLRELRVEASTDGLNGDGTYWHVMHVIYTESYKRSGSLDDAEFCSGYVHEDDVDWSKTEADKQSGDAKG